MIGLENYVCDTNSIISSFADIFHSTSTISGRALSIIEEAIQPYPSYIRLSIPSVVFIELFDKYLVDVESVREFYYKCYVKIVDSPNVEIKPIEKEVLQQLINLKYSLPNHDIHDKLILACAMTLECPLITSDSVLIDFVQKHRVIPEILS